MGKEETDKVHQLQHEDPYAFMIDNSRVSASQEQLLQINPFVGEIHDSPHHEMASQNDADLPVASAPIFMATLPDSQDVFHTPPEESSQLGFSETQLEQQIHVIHCAPELGEIRDAHLDEFVVLESEISDRHSPLKKPKLSAQNLGIVEDCVGNCHEEERSVELQRKENAGLRVLPMSISIDSKKDANEKEPSEDMKKNKFDVFSLLKALAENTGKDEEEEEDNEGISLFEAAKRIGVTFP